MNQQKTDKVNEMAIMSAALRQCRHARIKSTREHVMAIFHPQCLNVINETKKPSWLQCWKCMYQAFQTRKVSKIVEELCGKSVSKSFVSSLTEQLEPMVNEWQNRLLSEKNYPYLMTDVLYIKIEKKSSTLKKLSYSDWNNQRWRP